MLKFQNWKILTKLLVMMLMLSWIPLLISLAVGIKNSMTLTQKEVDNQVLQLISNNVQALVQDSVEFILQNFDNLIGISQSDLLLETITNLPNELPALLNTNNSLQGSIQLPLPGTPQPGNQQQNLPFPISESTAQINTYLSEIVASNEGIEMISVYDLNGTIIACSLPDAVGTNHIVEPAVSTALSGTKYIEKIHRGPNDIPGFFISTPIKTGSKIIGAVSARMEASFIVEELAGNIEIDHNISSLYIVDENGIVLVHSNPDSQWLHHSLVTLNPEQAKEIVMGYIVEIPCPEGDQACWDDVLAQYEIKSVPAAQPLGEALQLAFQSGDGGSIRYCYPDNIDSAIDASCASGNWHTAAYRAVKDPYNGQTLFVIVADVSEASYLDAARQRATFNIAGGIFVALLLVISSVFVARSMAQPINKLSGVAQEIEKDEPFEEAKLADLVKHSDELGNLARVFSKMAVVIQERERKLKKQVMELRIEIDESRRKEEVDRLTDNDFFKDLQAKAQEMKKQVKDSKNDE